jgi:hypothetical protein
VKLTMPSYDPGACRIMVDGRKVGYALARFWDWEAFLWVEADQADPRAIVKDGHVTRRTLRSLRAELRRRLAEDGPWWKVPDEDTGGNA